MRLPPPPHFLPRQRFAGRFWNTNDLMEMLAIYHGVIRAKNPRTWQHRTLIAVHREVCQMQSYRAGYGKDWKAEIKETLLEFQKKGTWPVVSLPSVTTFMRQAECAAWALARTQVPVPHLIAAE